jgi:hypothetical protein
MPSNDIRFCVRTKPERVIVVMVLLRNIHKTIVGKRGPMRGRRRLAMVGGWRPNERAFQLIRRRSSLICHRSRIKGNTPDRFMYTHAHAQTHAHTSKNNWNGIWLSVCYWSGNLQSVCSLVIRCMRVYVGFRRR